jgi:transcriptional regulator with XRE-family HTH domain
LATLANDLILDIRDVGQTRNTKYIKAFGANLKKLRESKKLTQEALAFKSELARSQVIRFEQGERSPTLSTILALAKGLGMEPKKLLDF